jgi:ubiquinone/menaquinone biosynthesis C-methylase UbiE
MTAAAPRGRRAGARLALGAVALGVGLWYRRHTTPFPYSQRWMLDQELPWLTRERLLGVLAPRPGERILEIGPGTGLFSLPVARALQPGGRLDVLDVQRPMLDHTVRCAREAGVENVEAALGDARRLPYPTGAFDAAFMMTVLGETRDQDATLADVRRVLRAGGRLVVGEFLIDWHAVPLSALRRRAARHGLRFESRHGPAVSYIARFAAA